MSTSSPFRLALLSLSLTSGLSAQVRPALVQSIDLAVPVPPVTVRVAGKTQLVYELHLTNFLSVNVELSRLQVLGADAPIADYRDAELARRLGRPGLARGTESPRVIGPGMRAVAYLWVELPDGARPPVVRNRVELDVLRPAGTVHAVVEGPASRVSRETSVVLGPPLRGGPWTAMYDPMMHGGHRTAIYTLNGRARIPARFAVDWVRLTADGTMATDATPHPPDWNGFGADVLAVGDGVVAAAMDDVADSPDPLPAARPTMSLENASGNYVTLDLGQGRFVFYEHLEHGSVAVKAGQRVKRGQVIGKLGNSGSSSMGPHLHFHVSDANSPLGAEGLPFVFSRFEHLGAFASLEAVVRGERWTAGPQKGVRILEHPSANSVVQFP